MKIIDEQIQWYKQNANSLYEDMISIELEKINSLYERYDDHADEMFVEEMIESFCKIIEKQRDKIRDIEAEGLISEETLRESKEIINISQEGFQNDKQLQAAFTQYCLNNGASSYTVNDYCSRIKKLWKSFEEDCRSGEIPDNLSSLLPETPWDGVLLNAFENTESLGRYIRFKIDETNGNRSLLNTRAALNKFDEFKFNCQRTQHH